jgi:Domain of unknown function (DUF1887)
MSNNLLVSLVSEQTIPNVQMIKQLNGLIDQYLFISTESMENTGQRNWIINATHIQPENLLEPKIVDQFSFSSIEENLDQIDFSVFDKIYVNLTGGTKVMTLAAFEFFKEVGAEIYYLTGRANERIKVSPGRKKSIDKINAKVTLSEYLYAYGFEIKETTGSGIDEVYTKKFFDLYTSKESGLPGHPMINTLREKHRDKGVKISDLDGLNEFLTQIDFPLSSDKLSKYEVKYLTGEWFEEWVHSKLQEEGIADVDNIKSGMVLSKKSREGEMVPNEMDVLFIHSDTLYTIECKTSVFHKVYNPADNDGQTGKLVSIIGEVIYKSDSMQKSFGLFAKTNIFILNSKDEKKVISESQKDRAKLSGIKIFYLDDLVNCQSLSQLMGIKI